MQYKVILLFCFFLLCYGATPYAQQERKTLTITANDSSSKIKASGHLLAENLNTKNTINTEVEAPYVAIPLAGNMDYFGEKTDYVNDYVKNYLKVHNSTLSYVKDRKKTPFQVIDDVLEKKNLPKELKYLAVIESALNPHALSKVGALGPWQLMAPTARMMGLTVSRQNDERTDWYKSTNAATRYLEYLYGDLQDWLLVVAAYNSGPVPVQKAIARTGSRNFWDIKKYLPKETQGHVLAFIATASIFENLSRFISLGTIPIDFSFNPEEEEEVVVENTKPSPTFPAVPGAKPAAGSSRKVETIVASKPAGTGMNSRFTMEELQSMTIVKIKEPIHLGFMAQELGISKNLLEDWNEDYEKFIYHEYPTPFYYFRFPKDKLDAFLKKKDHLTKRSADLFSQQKR